ncbi:MAG: hypothetical protein ACI4IX_02095, partial [Acutalibacteraceae bacterium]
MRIKKLIAIVLCLSLIFAIFAPAQVSAAEECNCNETPIIYVRGRCALIRDKDMPRDEVNNPDLPYVSDEYVQEQLPELVKIYANCYFLGGKDFTPFREKLTEVFKEIYKDYALDNNGNVTNNSGPNPADGWDRVYVPSVHESPGPVDTPRKAKDEVYRYFFQYDCRLDPCDTADNLYKYIQRVKESTGHSSVKIVARCLGTNILAAYLAEYGWSDIDDVIFYNAIMNGTAVTNSLFTGELYFDDDAVDFFANQNLEDTTVLTLIKQVITLANKTYGLGLTMDYINMTATDVAYFVIPDVMRVSYATTPGYWAMVSADRYIEARDYIFNGAEEEFAGLIEKLDHYYETVSSKIPDMLAQMEKDGVNIYIIAKYGYQLYPIMKDAAYQSDMIVTTAQQALGTTCAPIGQTLSKSYIQNAEANGFGKYISPDGAIDSSTSMFPDTTWYIKNMEHNCFPHVADMLLYKILRPEGEKMTVWDDPDYPQYIIYEGEENNGDTLIPMTPEEQGQTIKEPGFFETLFGFIKSLFKTMNELLTELQRRIMENAQAGKTV